VNVRRATGADAEVADRRAAAAGRRYLRLDCMRDNDGIQAYHERPVRS
jgi:hypothetical protein